MLSTKELMAAAVNERVQQHLLQFDSLLTMLQYKTPYRITSRYFGRMKNVLDWGCGNGHFSYYLTKNGIPSTGYSFDDFPAALKSSRLFTHCPASGKDPVRLPFNDESFDTVFSVGVLEHVYETGGNEVDSLREIDRILRPQGLFFCFHFPNKYQWIEPAGKLLGKLEHYHNRKYSIHQIKSFLALTNFDLLEWGRYNFLPRNQLRRLPSPLKENPVFLSAFQGLDSLLTTLLPQLCTNFYFVAVKK